MHNSTIIYKPIIEWKKVKNSNYMDANEQDTVKIVIGERNSQDPKERYIIEPIWTSMLSDMQENPYAYTAYIAPGAYPQLFIRRDHHLFLHNSEMCELISSCKQKLQNIDTDILCGALAEYRQEKRKKKEEEPCIEAVTKQVSAEHGKSLTHEFIGCLIADFFNDAYFEGDPTAAVVSNLSYEELKNLALDSIYRQMIGAFQSKEKEEAIKKMNIDPDDLQGAIQDELFRRLITGRIAGT